jgi:hypothetical protein
MGGRVAVLAGVTAERRGALGFDLAGPLGDSLGVGSGVEGGLVAGEPGVSAGDEGLGLVSLAVGRCLIAEVLVPVEDPQRGDDHDRAGDKSDGPG